MMMVGIAVRYGFTIGKKVTILDIAIMILPSASLDLLPTKEDIDAANDVVNTTTIKDDRRPYYTYFVHAEHMQLQNNCTTFCCKLFAERFGLIDYEMQVKPQSIMGDDTFLERPVLCFDQITFPKLEVVRHVYNDNVNAGIQMLRQRSWMVLRNALDSSPWSMNSNNTLPKILMFDRYDAESRHLVNASEIILELQQSYHAEIYRISADEWSSATLLQQAVLFNSYQYIISPHGAHLFNIITARPQTKVLEIQCLVTNRRWNGHQQWFSKWGTALDVSWRVYTEMEGCKVSRVNMVMHSLVGGRADSICET